MRMILKMALANRCFVNSADTVCTHMRSKLGDLEQLRWLKK